MATKNESSVLRSLAVTLGEGLAFGVGVKLTSGLRRQDPAVERALSVWRPLLEAAIREQAAQVESRVGEVERRLAAEVQSLRQQDGGAADRLAGDIAALKAEMVDWSRRIGEMVAEQVLSLELRVARVEEQVKAEREDRTRELAQFRDRLADTDANVMDVILAIGEMCRDIAGRMNRPAARDKDTAEIGVPA